MTRLLTTHVVGFRLQGISTDSCRVPRFYDSFSQVVSSLLAIDVQTVGKKPSSSAHNAYFFCVPIWQTSDSLMSWVPPPGNSPEYSDWPIESDENLEYLGTNQDGDPLFYHRVTDQVYRGSVDEGDRRLVPAEESSWELDPKDSLGQFIEQIGNDIGWESLSEFAREHIEESDN